MASLIQNVLQQSLVTFRSDQTSFSAQMTTLAGLVEKITAEDLNFDITFAEMPAESDSSTVAPMTYIHIFQDGVLSIGIFVLKANKTIPLHNHPDMYGLVKVLSGKIKIESYSLNTAKTREIDGSKFQNMEAPEGVVPRNILPAEFISSEICDSLSKPCVLEPQNKNIHEIHSVDGPAAFLHVLAPPYTPEVAANPNARRCSFYTILHKIVPEVFVLQEIECPAWYWSDFYPYTGPDPTEGMDCNAN